MMRWELPHVIKNVPKELSVETEQVYSNQGPSIKRSMQTIPQGWSFLGISPDVPIN